MEYNDINFYFYPYNGDPLIQEDIADRIEDLKNNYKNDTVRELLSISGQMVEI